MSSGSEEEHVAQHASHPHHPVYVGHILDAIESFDKPRAGVSAVKIKEYIAEYTDLAETHPQFNDKVKAALKTMEKSGKLVKVKHSYKLSPEARKTWQQHHPDEVEAKKEARRVAKAEKEKVAGVKKKATKKKSATKKKAH